MRKIKIVYCPRCVGNHIKGNEKFCTGTYSGISFMSRHGTSKDIDYNYYKTYDRMILLDDNLLS